MRRDTGFPQPTVHQYLNLLETSYQLVRLPAYSANRTKRLVKAPKLYWNDTALTMSLAGEHEPRAEAGVASARARRQLCRWDAPPVF